MSEFFAMGGYAAFVWPAYGITALVLVANFWWIRRNRANVLDSLRHQPDDVSEESRPTVRHVP